MCEETQNFTQISSLLDSVCYRWKQIWRTWVEFFFVVT